MKKILHIILLICLSAWLWGISYGVDFIDSDNDNIQDNAPNITQRDKDSSTREQDIPFICTHFDVKYQKFNCTSSDLWRFSKDKKDTLVDSDRDGVKDFEDRQPNTDEADRNFICTQRDITYKDLWGKYGCNNDSQLWVFSATKKAYILNNGGFIWSGWWGVWAPGSAVVDGGQIQNGWLNLDTGNIKQWENRNKPLEKLQEDGDRFIKSSEIGEKGIYDLLVTIAKDLKNIFFALATVFFLYLVLRLLFSENSEEDTGKFKRWILWITVGLIVMQLAYTLVIAVYDGGLWSQLGDSFVKIVIEPLIQLLKTLASFFFIVMGIIAFYRLITSNGEEQAASDAKTTIINAILWFILVQIAANIVGAVYNASSSTPVNTSKFIEVIIWIINWMNSFVGIAVIIMIIYAGAQVLLSAWDEEKLSQAKKALIYIAIGVAVLVMNFLILTFFLNPAI